MSFRVSERIKLRGNVSKSEVMGCSRYVNGGPMHVRLNDEQLEEVDFFYVPGDR